jgi:hypothetical protein
MAAGWVMLAMLAAAGTDAIGEAAIPSATTLRKNRVLIALSLVLLERDGPARSLLDCGFLKATPCGCGAAGGL